MDPNLSIPLVNKISRQKSIREAIIFQRDGNVTAHTLTGGRLRKAYLMFLLAELHREMCSTLMALTPRSLLVKGSAGVIGSIWIEEQATLGVMADEELDFESLDHCFQKALDEGLNEESEAILHG